MATRQSIPSSSKDTSPFMTKKTEKSKKHDRTPSSRLETGMTCQGQERPGVTPPKYYNEHLVYLNSGVATDAQIRRSINQALQNVRRKVNLPLPTYYRVNVVSNRSGKLFGYSYVWFTNPEVYNLAIGKNPDGSERVEYYDDPEWNPPTDTPDAPDAHDTPDTSITGPECLNIEHVVATKMSWADMVEEEERLQALYTRPKIRRELEHLMPLPPIEYEGDQHEQARLLLVEDAKRNETWVEGMTIEVPAKIVMTSAPAYVSPIEDKYCANVLCGLDIPAWISERDLKGIFTPYISKNIANAKPIRKLDGVSKEEDYPWVTLNKTRHMAFITFNPRNHDAQFALLMTRKIDFIRKDETQKTEKESEKRCTLIFNHAFRTN